MNGASRKIDHWIQEHQTFLTQARFTDARQALENSEPTTPAEARTLAHLKARLSIFEGNPAKALVDLTLVRELHGEHIRIQTDIANCHYLLGEPMAFRRCLDSVQKTLDEVRDRLGTDTDFRASIQQAKFLEEEGRIARSLDIYQELLDRHEATLTEEQRCRVLANQVRIRCLTEGPSGVSPVYHQLISARETIGELSLSEIRHALILAETVLAGVESGISRATDVIRREELPPSLRRLALYDLLELFLQKGVTPPEAFKTLSENFSDRDPYESALHALAWGSFGIDELNAFAPRLTCAGYLRVLALMISRETDSGLRRELRIRWTMILQGLDPASRKLWEKRTPKDPQGCASVSIHLDRNTKQLRFEDRVLNLSKKPVLWALLETIAASTDKTLASEELVSLLWKGEFNESYYFRLRTTITRINKLLETLTAESKLLFFDDDRLKLKAGFVFRL